MSVAFFIIINSHKFLTLSIIYVQVSAVWTFFLTSVNCYSALLIRCYFSFCFSSSLDEEDTYREYYYSGSSSSRETNQFENRYPYDEQVQHQSRSYQRNRTTFTKQYERWVGNPIENWLSSHEFYSKNNLQKPSLSLSFNAQFTMLALVIWSSFVQIFHGPMLFLLSALSYFQAMLNFPMVICFLVDWKLILLLLWQWCSFTTIHVISLKEVCAFHKRLVNPGHYAKEDTLSQSVIQQWNWAWETNF